MGSIYFALRDCTPTLKMSRCKCMECGLKSALR
jgi:hypothetical protein